MNKHHILNEIKRTAEANGGVPLGKQRFFQETGIKAADWEGKIWKKWSDAVREAELEPNHMQVACNDDVMIEHFIQLMRDLGHFPTGTEVRLKAHSDTGFPSHNTFTARLGSKQHCAAKILSYCAGRAEYADVVAICAPFAEPSESARSKDEEIELEEVDGFVYLMKSGRYYKIGRSNAAGRREYELAIQLPEKLVTVHAIRTDDPSGIEYYWHRRFAAKRKNGEWFDLSGPDVKAFKPKKVYVITGLTGLDRGWL